MFRRNSKLLFPAQCTQLPRISRHKQALCLISYLLLTLPLKVTSTKCHLCMFHLAHCTNPLDCYNQPDTCSNTNFSPLQAPAVDCEFGCEQYVITDATGSIVVWRRGCASERSPRSSYICFSRNIYFLRHEQCWCHSDYCNSTRKLFAWTSGALAVCLAALSSVYLVHVGAFEYRREV